MLAAVSPIEPTHSKPPTRRPSLPSTPGPMRFTLLECVYGRFLYVRLFLRFGLNLAFSRNSCMSPILALGVHTDTPQRGISWEPPEASWNASNQPIDAFLKTPPKPK